MLPALVGVVVLTPGLLLPVLLQMVRRLREALFRRLLPRGWLSPMLAPRGLGLGRLGFLSDTFALSFSAVEYVGLCYYCHLLSLSFSSRLVAFCVINTATTFVRQVSSSPAHSILSALLVSWRTSHSIVDFFSLLRSFVVSRMSSHSFLELSSNAVPPVTSRIHCLQN